MNTIVADNLSVFVLQLSLYRLVNSDFAIEYPAPIEPDTVLIGGFAVDRRPAPLATDLEEFVASSGDFGVIVMSFGTLTKRFDRRRTEIFAAAFARLPQRVVWRYHGDVANLTLPANVRLERWLPQVSLLAHPHTRLFVSHCGLNGLFEAAHYGVPILAVPLSGDQFNNAAKVSQRLGMGRTVDIESMTVESLYDDLTELLVDKSYRVNALSVARRLADQPLTPVDKICFWVDYVVRHRGAVHLRSDAAKLPWYQYLSLDVVIVLVAICIAVVGVIGYVVRQSLRLALRLALSLACFVCKMNIE